MLGINFNTEHKWEDFLKREWREKEKYTSEQKEFLKKAKLTKIEKEKNNLYESLRLTFKTEKKTKKMVFYADFKHYRWKTPYTSFDEEYIYGEEDVPFLTLLDKFRISLIKEKNKNSDEIFKDDDFI